MFAAIKLQWSVFVYDIPQKPTTAAAAATTTTTVVIRSVMCSFCFCLCAGMDYLIFRKAIINAGCRLRFSLAVCAVHYVFSL